MPHRGLQEVTLQPAVGNVFEAVVGQLATAIRLGAFADGEQLPPERELSERLGVSRMTLRDAIAALRDAGLVRTTRGRGGGTVVTYDGTHAPGVRPAGEYDVADVLRFRRLVEPGAVEAAAERALDGEQQAWLSECLADAANTVGTREHRIADSRLHLALATLSGSALLVEAVTRAQTALGDLLAAIPVLPRNIEHSQAQHARIVDAVLCGDVARAGDAMRRHCDATAELLTGLIG
ncbi:FadR family transcriptional regulator [Allobranchiibius sp. CTAmp26]|nr:FadR family transcriptional regulator [Allobranchiibius sp. CTAmp26]